MKSRNAFTLIELLIVVAIIAILAAIAVPNFLEAQVRSKVSRVKADMRTLATALESYAVDFNKFPPDRNYTGSYNLNMPPQGFYVNYLSQLSTPIAYMTSSKLLDPFYLNEESVEGGPTEGYKYQNSGYGRQPPGRGNWGDLVAAANSSTPQIQKGYLPRSGFILTSYGPDKAYDAYEWVTFGLSATVGGTVGSDRIYDPTNGTVSRGDIGRLGGSVTEEP